MSQLNLTPKEEEILYNEGVDVAWYKKLHHQVAQQTQPFDQKIGNNRRMINDIESSVSNIAKFITTFITGSLIVAWIFFPFSENPMDKIALSIMILFFTFFIVIHVIHGLYHFTKYILYETLFASELRQIEELTKKNDKLRESRDHIRGNITKVTVDFEEGMKQNWEKYNVQLEKFYHNYLYRKRASTSTFPTKLKEFEEMIEYLSTLRDLFDEIFFHTNSRRDFIITDKSLYEQYIKKRKGDVQKYQDIDSLPISKNSYPFGKSKRKKSSKTTQATGRNGEEIVVLLEKESLNQHKRQSLAEKVVNVAQTQGDGLGYDVLSFFPDGREKYIEVKSTRSDIYTPFVMTANEVSFLQSHPSNAFLYRVKLPYETSADISMYSSEDFFRLRELTPHEYQVTNIV